MNAIENAPETRPTARKAGPLTTLFSIYIWAVWIVVFAIGCLLAIPMLMISRQLGFMAVKATSWIALHAAGIRVTIKGAEKVDWSKAYVFMGNHQNILDGFVFALGIKKHIIGIEKKETLKFPIYGWLTQAWGNLPIDRSNPQAARDTIALAEERLKAGTSIAILPEGTRTKDGSVGPFKKGGFHLALNTGADIVPFTINGAYELKQTGDWRVRPGEIEMIFDHPIATRDYDKDAIEALMAEVRGVICKNFKGEGFQKT